MKSDKTYLAGTLPNEGFVRLHQILQVYPVSKSTWWAGIGTRFPRPIKLGPRTTAWRVEDIRNLIEKSGVKND